MTTPQTTREITGHTRVYGILADPIHHVKTPQMLNALMAREGRDGVMVPFHVASDDLATLVAGLKAMKSLGGFVVTVPHKTAIVDLCDAVSDSARRIGAVNTVRREADGRLIGEMLDGKGFVGGLLAAGIDPRGKSVYLAGAGGAANAIAFAFVESGISRLTIANRTRAKAEDLAARLAEAYPTAQVDIGTPDPSGHDIVVNGTSLGLKEGDALPLDTARLSPEQIVAEVIMQPEETALLAAAKAKGCRIHFGKPMLACQLDLMADFLGMRTLAGAGK
ncbi:UNVERIFIED_ORG: shikimate dehydrogenase [Xanthobacter viscosus]|jgi:shikimate dehydrogenase|uniref:shikimate dehydrogenase (NADP(+)) n=1 Tax=Xanthobacter autotrophicus TaxID=280 RepID=A0A6C1KJX1_XANAU|nr:shikimate dehydrogenase [Xanthobacter autotrophicus]TLX44510.1 shikimate dehydrogenase [Xanthobacter autotrophicus]